MAASLLSRGCLSSQARRLYIPLFSSPFRLSSSKKDETDNAPPLDQGSEVKFSLPQDKTTDASSLETPIVDSNPGLSPSEGAVDKFFKIVERVTKSQKDIRDSHSEESGAVVETVVNESFATMFRKSKFVSLGEFKGRLLEGKIFEVMEDDLYIDFGGKFHCVCPRPKRNAENYHRGTKVLVNLQAMEMSSAFLGSDIHVTLLEGDGTLLGLAASSRPQGASNVEQSRARLVSPKQT